jgi:shikimate-5-dehydrogenase/3-dehydroquinate dehydratase type I
MAPSSPIISAAAMPRMWIAGAALLAGSAQSFSFQVAFGVQTSNNINLASCALRQPRCGGHPFDRSDTMNYEMSTSLQSALLPTPTTTKTSSAEHIKTETILTGESRPFQDDTPIVLVGFSGAGNEVSRLADSLTSGSNGSVVPILEEDVSGVSIVAPDGAKDLLRGKKVLSSKDVITMDFANPVMSKNDGENKMTIMSSMLETLEYLEKEERCLVIYVNVDAEAGLIDPIPSELKSLSDLEEKLISMSHYEIAILDEGSEGNAGWVGIEAELVRLVAHANLPKAEVGSDLVQKTMGKNTFFLSLSFDHVSKTSPYIEAMCKDVDAMELRVDLLAANQNRHSVLHQLQQLRNMCRPHAIRAPAISSGASVVDDALPIVYTVRTRHQAGIYPDDDAGIIRMFELLKLGLRGGVEVLDVESAWDPTLTANLLDQAEATYPSTMILGSHHVVGEEVSTAEAVKLFRNCALDGRAHGAKVVLSLDEGNEEKATMAYDAGMIAAKSLEQEGNTQIPNVSLVLGDVGQQSRVVNLNFTPVTHESLPMVAAPGQLSARELMLMRLEQGLIKSQQYAILGHNIAYSVSPQMQGGAFEATGLPHQYGRADVEDVTEFVTGNLFTSEDFGGASVTIPHKQSIMPYVDVLSDAAKEIGAVNTLVAQYDEHNPGVEHRTIFGDNTDWLGIFNPMKRKLSALAGTGAGKKGAALILGGGGTARAAAYAARQLGLERIYYNRTPSKAQDLAETFGGVVVSSLDEKGDSSLGDHLSSSQDVEIQAVISTLPAAAKFQLPSWLVKTAPPKVVLDVNYKPYHTPLLDQCESANIETIRGSEMLWEQGVGQFEMWTGRLAPYKIMKQAVLENCLPKED